MSKQLPSWINLGLGLCLVGVSVGMPPFLQGTVLSVMSGAAAADLQTIRDRGKLIVAVKDNLRPLGFRGADSQLQGFEIDIAQRLATELLGKPDAVIFKPVLNQDRLKAVIDQQVDVAIAQVTYTPGRARIVAFSQPYYTSGIALATRDARLQKPADISTQTIAILRGSSALETVRYRWPKANLVTVNSYKAAQELLENGGAIAVAADATVLSGWLSPSSPYRLLTPTLSADFLCIVLPKGLQHDELRRRIDETLRKWKVEGWLQERAAFWGLP